MLISLPMKHSLDEVKKHRENAEAALNKTTQLQKAFAKLEADLSRKENQKVTEKSKKT